MSLLTAIQDVMALLGQGRPTSIISNADNTVQQFLALAQVEADDTFPKYNWRNSRIDVAITGDGVATLWPLPSDWERPVTGSAWWSQKYPSVPLLGPVSESEMLRMKALPVMPVRPIWRLIGGMIEIWPALDNGEIVRSVYYSQMPISAVDGLTRYLRWTNDNDFPMFPETILRNGIKWRWKAGKGLDYAEDFRTWNDDRELKASHEIGGRVIHMSDTHAMPDNQWPGIVIAP